MKYNVGIIIKDKREQNNKVNLKKIQDNVEMVKIQQTRGGWHVCSTKLWSRVGFQQLKKDLFIWFVKAYNLSHCRTNNQRSLSV